MKILILHKLFLWVEGLLLRPPHLRFVFGRSFRVLFAGVVVEGGGVFLVLFVHLNNIMAFVWEDMLVEGY